MATEQYASQTQMPPWIEAMYKKMAEQAEGLSNEPYKPYPIHRQRLAELTPDILRAHQMTRQAEGAWIPDFMRAQNYLEQGTQRFPQHYQEYMNPYQDAVVNRLAHLSERAYKENFLPHLENAFVGAGQHGSTRHQELAARGARDAQEALQAQQAEALMKGYENAGRLFNVEQTRNLAAAPESAKLGQGKLENLAADAAKAEAVGQTTRERVQNLYNMSQQEFENQRNHPWQQLEKQNTILKGYPQSQSTVGGKVTPEPRELNTIGKLGVLAGQFYNKYQHDKDQGYGRKAGGLMKLGAKKTMNIPRLKPLPRPKKQGAAKAPGNMKKLGASSLTQSNMTKAPKLGGKFSFNKTK